MWIAPIEPDEWSIARTVRLDALAGSPPGTFSSSHSEALRWGEQQWREWAGRRHPFFVARADSGPVGSAGVIVTAGGPELVSMWTAPAARGTGVSDRLVGAVIEWARTAGHRELRLWVLGGNRPAEQLYRRTGFVRTGAVQPCGEYDPRPEYEMARALTHER
ncbi:GNAT family N-acetyltransferase [Nocardia sp. NPDC051750]|uniref:GNAT family N-acetyltransferase n=1 Tax=Nocardia sp. NPDC051750 TaxID=3364325 RepID=UPI0037AA10D3